MKTHARSSNTDLRCPIDRNKVDVNHVFPDKGIERLVFDLTVKCPSVSEGEDMFYLYKPVYMKLDLQGREIKKLRALSPKIFLHKRTKIGKFSSNRTRGLPKTKRLATNVSLYSDSLQDPLLLPF